LKKFVVFLSLIPVYLYRLFLRPLKGGSTCAYTPSCSQYAIIAIRRHGPIKGWWLAGLRVLRCNPFSRKNRGYDPVPYRMKGGAKWVV